VSSRRYKYFIDQSTKNLLSNFDSPDWIRLFKQVLRDEPIEYNIEFSEPLPVSKLAELYDLVTTLRLNETTFQEGLMMIFREYYGNKDKALESYYLVRTLDYVKPSMFFKQLVSMVINEQYDDMIYENGEDGYSIHLLLTNSLIKFDLLDRSRPILKYLLARKNLILPPEYYQVTIRYLYRLNNPEEFRLFMNGIISVLKDGKVFAFVMNVFKEYFFYKKSLELVFYWMFDNVEKRENHLEFRKLTRSLFNILSEYENDYREYFMFCPMFAFLSPRENVKWSSMIDKIRADFQDLHAKVREKYFYYLGYNHDNINYRESYDDREPGKFIFGDETEVQVPLNESELFYQLYLGIRDYKTERLSEAANIRAQLIITQEELEVGGT
jgi:hypothetical protein